jgi:hypothetical protein
VSHRGPWSDFLADCFASRDPTRHFVKDDGHTLSVRGVSPGRPPPNSGRVLVSKKTRTRRHAYGNDIRIGRRSDNYPLTNQFGPCIAGAHVGKSETDLKLAARRARPFPTKQHPGGTDVFSPSAMPDTFWSNAIAKNSLNCKAARSCRVRRPSDRRCGPVGNRRRSLHAAPSVIRSGRSEAR